LAAQIANYFQYFDWQWTRSLKGNVSWFGGLRPVFTIIFIALGLFGAFTHYQRDKKSWAYFAILLVTLSFGLTFYLNFKYGYTFPNADLGPEAREVRERDYFFIVSFSLWGLWAGLGVAALWQWLGEKYLRVTRPEQDLPPLSLSPVLLLALIPLALNWSWATRRHDYAARDWAYNLLNSVEPYAVLFTNGDNDTFPLWYAQEVEGIRKDVTVIVMSYLNTPWYVRQIKRLTEPCKPGQDPASDPTRIICQRPFDLAKGPRLYSDSMVTTPSSSAAPPPGKRLPTKTIIPLTDDQIREFANTYPYRLDQPFVFRAHNIQANVPAGSIVLPSTLFMAQIINQSLGDRPIYFASTTNSYEDLGLGNFLIRQGVAFKLNDGAIQGDAARGLVAMPATEMRAVSGPFIDLKRTEKLLSEVFVHRKGFPENWANWVDVATQNIPYYYFATHLITAQAYALSGDSAQAERHMAIAEKWSALSQR
jgi:hypothetical protein